MTENIKLDEKTSIFKKPLRIPKEGEKVYELSDSEIEKILRMRGLKTELDPGMGGVSPDILDKYLKSGADLASLDLALLSGCNFKCLWCYRPDEEWGKLILEFDKIEEIIEQAAELGTKFYVLTGGEPTMYHSQRKNYFDVVDRIHKVSKESGIEASVLTFTDVALIDEQFSKKLADRKVALCLKRDTLNHGIQNLIVGSEFGIKDASQKIEKGYQNLFNAKYGSNPNLAVSVNTVLARGIVSKTKQEIDTLKTAIDLHLWVKSNGMEHSIVPIHYCGEASDGSQVEGITPLDVKVLYDILAEIDTKQFNDPWTVYSGFPKNKTCNRPGRGVHIRATGKVTSCSESPLIEDYVFGDIHKQGLRDIIKSEKFQEFRKEFADRNGTYICNANVCDLNANDLCRGGCATRSAFSRIDPETGLIIQNTNMHAYSKGREDPLCPGWIVLAQKQGVLREGIYEKVAKNLLDNSRFLDSDSKRDIFNSIVKRFYSNN